MAAETVDASDVRVVDALREPTLREEHAFVRLPARARGGI